MIGIIRKLSSLAIAFTVVCLVAVSFPQFNVLTPTPVMAADSATYYFDAHDAVTVWTNNSDNMTDGSTGTYASTDRAEVQLNNSNTCPGTDLGTISVVELRTYGYMVDDDTIELQPVFGGTVDGDLYPWTLPVGAGNADWSPYFNITSDLGAPGSWTWNDVIILDVNVDYIKVGGGDLTYIAIVEIRVSYITIIDRPVAQGITISDGVATAFDGGWDASQGITLTDGVTATFAKAKDVSQGITVSDGVTAAFERGRDASQGITISDGVTATFDRGRNVSQGITISDGVTTAIVASAPVSQGVTISDGVTTAIVASSPVSQGITLTDGVTAAFARGKDVSQGITISDGVTTTTGVSSPVSQGVTISDGVTTAFDGGRDASQGITISDGVTIAIVASSPVSQGITISDGVTVTTGAASPVSQGITISDGVTTAFDGGWDASQGITISDGVTVATGEVCPVSQGITITDGVTATVTAGSTRNVSQGITISDGVTATVTRGTPGGGGGGGAPPPPPAPPLPPGTTDVSGFVSADGTFTATVVIESVDGKCGLTINEGTTGLSGDGSPIAEIAVTEMQDPPAPPENSHIIGLTYDLGPEGATFTPAVTDTPAVTITWSYNPDTLPEGVTEENLVLAYYDEAAGEWVELPSIVDTVNHTITASVSHFTTFAIIARAAPPPEPATFSLSNLSIQPAEVQSEEAVTITVLVVNTGGMEGSHTVELEIEGVEEAEKNITVAAGDSRSVSFSVSREDAGSYSVVVGELSGSFTIAALPAPPVAPALNWPLLGGAAAAIWGLLIYLGRRKIGPLASATLPKLRALLALLVAVRLKTVPFTRRMISYLAYTALPKFRALIALLVAVRLKIAPFTRRMISSLISRVKH